MIQAVLNKFELVREGKKRATGAAGSTPLRLQTLFDTSSNDFGTSQVRPKYIRSIYRLKDAFQT